MQILNIKTCFWARNWRKYKVTYLNYRFEEGKGNEKWYVSCEDLIKSRFYKEEM